jgi:hypothetical protein
MYKILNEEQEQGLWETLASITSPIIVNLVEDSDSDLGGHSRNSVRLDKPLQIQNHVQ